jgi:hypothetical protein
MLISKQTQDARGEKWHNKKNYEKRDRDGPQKIEEDRSQQSTRDAWLVERC